MSKTGSEKSLPSRKRFFARRLGVLAVVMLVGYSIVRVVAANVGGDGSVVVGANGPDSLAATTEVDEAADAPADTTAATDVAADVVTTASASTDQPTADDPAKVLIVGDSGAGTFGPYLQQILDGTQILETELNYKVSSGLSRPDFFDWPAELRETVPEVDPDIVVVTFGGNDAQGLAIADGEFIIGDPVANEDEWTEEYMARAGEVMDFLLEDGRTVVWVGIPNDNNPVVTARMAVQDQAVKAAAAERPEIIFVDTWVRFSGRDGGWAEFVIDPRDGQGKDVRAGDGFHLNVEGAEILALDIAEAIRNSLREAGVDI